MDIIFLPITNLWLYYLVVQIYKIIVQHLLGVIMCEVSPT